MSKTLSEIASASQPSIVRIRVYPKEGEVYVGTGFSYLHSGQVITAAHVLFRQDRIDDLWKEGGVKLTKNIDLTLENLLQEELQRVQVETMDGTVMEIEEWVFDARVDIGVLKFKPKVHLPQLAIYQKVVKLGEDIFTAGFPYTIQMDKRFWPYAVCRGTITSFVDVAVGGYKTRRMIQAFLPALSGASGSPIFTTDGEVCGMINGQMLWGDSKFVFQKEREDGTSIHVPDSLYVPLPIAFVTPIDVVIATAERLLTPQESKAPILKQVPSLVGTD